MPCTFSVYGIILYTDNKQTLCSTWNNRGGVNKVCLSSTSFFYPPQSPNHKTPIHSLITPHTHNTSQHPPATKPRPIKHKFLFHTNTTHFFYKNPQQTRLSTIPQSVSPVKHKKSFHVEQQPNTHQPALVNKKKRRLKSRLFY